MGVAMANYCAAGSGNTTARPCSSCLQNGARGHRVEAAGLSLRSHQRLAQVQESGSAGGEARGRGGCGANRMAGEGHGWLAANWRGAIDALNRGLPDLFRYRPTKYQIAAIRDMP